MVGKTFQWIQLYLGVYLSAIKHNISNQKNIKVFDQRVGEKLMLVTIFITSDHTDVTLTYRIGSFA